jgi:phosphoribosylglycinamide formyltransferase 2
LHLRAILGLPIGDICLRAPGASSVILATNNGTHPLYEGIDTITVLPYADLRIFGKPTTRFNRRMGVILVSPNPEVPGQSALELTATAKTLANQVKVKSKAE